MMTASLKENLSYFNQQFDGSADFIVRQFQITGTDAALLTLEGMVNKQVIVCLLYTSSLRWEFRAECGVAFGEPCDRSSK